MYHYVYRLNHIETDEFYFGVRSSKIPPEQDSYMGSMKRWKPDKSKLKKTIMRTFETREEANEHEEYLINRFCHYDLNRNYHSNKNWCMYGSEQTEEAKKKISSTLKVVLNKPEAKQKRSAARLGKPLSEYHRSKISSSKKEKPLSEKNKKGLSLSLKGKPKSEETRQKMSVAKLGKKQGPLSEETRQKMSVAKLGKKRGPYKKKIKITK